MTSDVDLARLMGAVERAGAKLVLVGDDRQLDAVGPGGALTALATRHPEHVWTLGENLRQTDPGERAALAELRHGNPTRALAWYAAHDRPSGRRPAPGDAGHGGRLGGRHRPRPRHCPVGLRRDNGAALNLAARHLWENAGLLSGPELTAPGGARYRATAARSPVVVADPTRASFRPSHPRTRSYRSR
jgi:hypothetical protein